MIKFNVTYTINNGQESVVFKEGKGNTITGEYNDGTLTGTLEGNVLKATFHNKKTNGAGLIEFTFTDNGFSAKWKQGLEPGPMRGKWKGLLVSKSEINAYNENTVVKEVVIEVSGRIPKYFFGVLREEYRDEVKEAIQYSNEDIETENDFINLVFSLTLDGWEDPKKALFSAISKEDLEKLPKFNELVNDFIENGGSHFEMIDCLFDNPDLRKYGSYYGISFFEDDAQISIVDVENDQTLVEETSIEEFCNGETFWAEEVEEGSEEYKDIQRITEFKSANSDFGFDPEDDYYSWKKNDAGATFLSCQLMYPELDEFTESHPREEQVTIYFDDITTWSFYIDTEDEDFDMNNLTFVSYPGAEEFRNSACDIVFSHLFYKNELIQPDENWIRDKGIKLMYGKSRGLERLDFFING